MAKLVSQVYGEALFSLAAELGRIEQFSVELEAVAAIFDENPQYCARFDMDPEQSIVTRKNILDMAVDNGLKLFGMHFPEPYYLQLSW